MDSNNKSTGIKPESGSTGANDKADEMSLIEEAIAEAEQDIEEGTDLIAVNETKTEDTHEKNMVHTDLKLTTKEHTYNLRQRSNPRPEYTKRYRFQAMIIYRALTKMLMKRRIKGKKRLKSGD